jgi:hypothetical protein
MSTNARDEQVRVVLLSAAKLIEENGWGQGWSRRTIYGRDHYSIDGAIDQIMIDTPPLHSWDAPENAVLTHLGVDSLCSWNDAPDRTRAGVVAALRGAAEGMGKERAE